MTLVPQADPASDLPRVSIVTPSYNQASFLEQTILSVLQQEYPNIEYMVLDGGSTDGSADIIRKYSSRLAYWHTRKDRGQWDAINQGIAKSSGEIVAYLNSDDCLAENAVDKIVRAFREHPDAGLVYGRAITIDAEGRPTGERRSWEWDLDSVLMSWDNPVPQPSTFLRRSMFTEFGGFDESLAFVADFEFWLRISLHTKFIYLPEVLSIIRHHPAAKTFTIGNQQARELIELCSRIRGAGIFADRSLDADRSTGAAWFRASQFYREGGFKTEALRAFWKYCWMSFSPPVALYRWCRYLAGILLKTW